MVKKVLLALSTVCLLATLTGAQEQSASEIATLPLERGVYYQSPSGWTSLPFTVLIPSVTEGGWTLWPSTTVTQVKAPYAEVRITGLRPTLFLRGISPAVGVYLVREIQEHNHRKLRMNVRRDEWARFTDTIPLEMEQVSQGVVRLRPRGNLPEGEYALATGFERGASWIFLGFEFGINAKAEP